jgi:hypothetical protein
MGNGNGDPELEFFGCGDPDAPASALKASRAGSASKSSIAKFSMPIESREFGGPRA